MVDGGRWSKENEKNIIKLRDTIITHNLQGGYSVIVDDTNLHPKHIERMQEIAKEHGAILEINSSFCDVSLEKCIENDLKRLASVGEKVIRDMHRKFLYKPQPKPLYQEGKPRAVICDLDGTLAHMNGRGPYDWDRVDEDTKDDLIHRLIRLVQTELDVDVILLSGRDEVCRAKTESWLYEHGVSYKHLFMRPAGDNRKDNVVKEEIYQNHIAGRFNVLFVLDDRDQVVRMWRDIGLTCFQVADGDF